MSALIWYSAAISIMATLNQLVCMVAAREYRGVRNFFHKKK